MGDTKSEREARLAAALRDNLKRRKDQARARRNEAAQEAPTPASGAEPDTQKKET